MEHLVDDQQSTTGAPVDTEEQLSAVVEPLIRAEGFDSVEVQLHRGHHGGRHRRRVRVIVYRASGLDAAALERLSRALQFRLSLNPELADAALEVSSPGIERVLKAAREYAIFTGKAVRILRTDAAEWERAVIEAASGEAVTLSFGAAVETLPIATIRRAQLTGAERGRQ